MTVRSCRCSTFVLVNGTHPDADPTPKDILMNDPVSPPPTPVSSRRLRHLTQLMMQDSVFIYLCFSEDSAGVFNARRGVSTLVNRVSKGEVGTLIAKGIVCEFSRSSRGVRYARGGRNKRAGTNAADRRRAKFLEADRFFQVAPDTEPQAMTVNLGESPLGWLARRKNAAGKPYLTDDEVAAGERLRADFERAQLGPAVTQDWRRFLAPGAKGAGGSAQDRDVDGGAEAARQRVMDALVDLGPGLSDAALRTCCFLEGLEMVEAKMSWSARSAKIVLKIALQRLADHYLRANPATKNGEIRAWQAPSP